MLRARTNVVSRDHGRRTAHRLAEEHLAVFTRREREVVAFAGQG